jgi:hypothetical protein
MSRPRGRDCPCELVAADLFEPHTRCLPVRYLEPVRRPRRRSTLSRRLWLLAALLAIVVLAGLLARLF